MKIVSIIIPCYNQAHFLVECIESCLAYNPLEDIEIIVVNDGSSDNTQQISNELKSQHPSIIIINQENKGLAGARNAGISIAKGKYILPLDADNKIKPDYIHKSIKILESNKVDIVYSKPIFFGEDIPWRKFSTRKFDKADLLISNYIDACAVYKKEVWSTNGGYDGNIPYCGVEDWDFWIKSSKNNFRFYFIDEELYFYRIHSQSMIAQTIEKDKNNANFTYLISKHFMLYTDVLKTLNYYKIRVEFEDANPFRTALKYLVKALKIRK